LFSLKKKFLGFFSEGGVFLDLIDCPAFPQLDSMTHVSMKIIKLNVI